MSKRLTQEQVERALFARGFKVLSEYKDAKTKIRLRCSKGHEFEGMYNRLNAGANCPHCTGRIVCQETLKKVFAEEGYELLGSYTSSKEKLQYRCPKGHVHAITYNSFRSGHRCAYCAGQALADAEGDLIKAFDAEGYTLVGKYVNRTTPVQYRCPEGHLHATRPHNFFTGKRCPYCKGLKVVKEDIKTAFEKEGYTLLNEYTNSRTPIDYICPKGHRHSMTWASFSSGSRCAFCAKKRMTHEIVEKAFEENGYKLHSQYITNLTLLKFTCPNNHQHHIRWSEFNAGKRCEKCSGNIINPEEVYALFAEHGYRLLDKYTNAKTKMRYICPAGHESSSTHNNFRSGCRCGVCSGRYITHEQVKEAYEKEGYVLLERYEKANKRMLALCDKGHEHSTLWNSFQRGVRCVHCAEYGFKLDKPGTLYYIAFNHPDHPTPLYKIGITNLTVEQRFRGEPTPYRIIHTESYLFGFLAYEKEQRILAQHAAHKYTGANLLVSGNTELFTSDILNLDKAAHKQSPLPDRRSA